MLPDDQISVLVDLTQDKPGYARGYSLAFLSALLLSTTAIFIRHLVTDYQLPPLVLAFWRDVFVALTLVVVLTLKGRHLLRISANQLKFLVVYGAILAVFNILWTVAIDLNGAAVATVLSYSSVAFTAVLAWRLLGESLGPVMVFAVVLSLSGCVLVANAIDPAVWVINPWGLATGVLAGLCYAAYSLMGRTAANRGLNPWTTVLYTFGTAAGFLLITNLVIGSDLETGAALSRLGRLFWLGDSVMGWGLLFALAAGPTLMGFGTYNSSLSLLPSSIANLILTTEPMFTAVIAYFLLGEQLSGIQLAGSAMILCGVLFLRLSKTNQ